MQSLTFMSHCALAYTLDLSYIYVVCMWIYVFLVFVLYCCCSCVWLFCRLRICCSYFICYKSINYYRIVFDFLFLSFAWLNAYIEILT